MAITLSDAQTALSNWLTADAAVAKGQSYSINGRSLSRVNAAEIREQIVFWTKVEAQLQRKANGQRRIGISLARLNG